MNFALPRSPAAQDLCRPLKGVPTASRALRPLLLLVWVALLTPSCGNSGAPSTSADADADNTDVDIPASTTKPTGVVNTGAGTNAPTPINGTAFARNDKLAISGLTALPLVGCVPSVYSGQITLGDEAFYLLVDSGSTTTAVAASTCSNCSSLNPTYDVAGASAKGGTAQATYGDQSGWKGTVYQDEMGTKVGDAYLTPMVSVNFAGITQESDFFTSSICAGDASGANAYQGILGLGPDWLLEGETTSYMDAVRDSGLLRNDVYSVQLCDVGGRMWFGGYDPAFIAGEPQYTPIMPFDRRVTATAYYSINMKDLAVGGTSLNLAASAIGASVVDTGTSSFLLKPTAFAALTSKIASDANFSANFQASLITQGRCGVSAQGLNPAQIDAALPTVTMSFPNSQGTGNFTVTLPATQSYLIALEQPSGVYAYCSVVNSSSLPILGAAVMRNHVMVFDRDTNRVGFVPQAPCKSGLPRAQVR